MSVAEIKPAASAKTGMDRKIQRKRWSLRHWPIAAKLVGAGIAIILVTLLVYKLTGRSVVRTIRVPRQQVSVSTVEQGTFRDLIPLRATVVPRTTVYIDAIDGGRVDRVLVEAGDRVQAGQPLVELSNTNLALSIIQQESQLNQAISQLQQNEIVLEQDKLSNERALAEIHYGLVRLRRSSARRETLATSGAISAEQRDQTSDELGYYEQLEGVQTMSSKRQSDLRERLLPDIHRQLDSLRGNLDVVRGKLDGLIVRAPVAGRVTAIDLKVGEHRDSGQRLAEVTPETGMKLSADIDEFYLSRAHVGQAATIDLNGKETKVTVQRVLPQVHNGQFTIDLTFDGASPPDLVEGESAHGRLQLGGDTATRILGVGPFLERTGGDWVFVVARDGKSAERRRIKVGRRTTEQLEILSGLSVGERALTSDYTGLDTADRIVLTD
jgi:HlyD family secretion protein